MPYIFHLFFIRKMSDQNDVNSEKIKEEDQLAYDFNEVTVDHGKDIGKYPCDKCGIFHRRLHVFRGRSSHLLVKIKASERSNCSKSFKKTKEAKEAKEGVDSTVAEIQEWSTSHGNSDVWCRVEFYDYNRETFRPCELFVPTKKEEAEFWRLRNIIDEKKETIKT